MSRHLASFVSLLISGGLLVVLYLSIDVRMIGAALLGADRLWLVLSVGMILPITVLRAVRFRAVAPPAALPGLGEALRLTLVSTALNVVVPAKGGDLVKSYFVAKRSETSPGVALAIILYERLCDVFALIAWCLVGWLVGRPQVPGLTPYFWILLGVLGGACGVLVTSERAAALLPRLIALVRPRGRLRRLGDLAEGWPDLLEILKGRRRWIVPFSLVLWLTHLFQIWLFAVTLAAPISFTVCASLSAIALMAGQLPFTIAGLGTRDAALVLLLAGYVAPESAAAMGILIATRNLVPPLIGIPLMRPYLTSVLGEARRWRRAVEMAR